MVVLSWQNVLKRTNFNVEFRKFPGAVPPISIYGMGDNASLQTPCQNHLTLKPLVLLSALQKGILPILLH